IRCNVRALKNPGSKLRTQDCLGRSHLRAFGEHDGQAEKGLPSEARGRERRREPQAASLPVVIGSGFHPFPFRTRKLSLIPPMVLHGKLCGRVGRCRQSYTTAEGPMRKRVGPFACTPTNAGAAPWALGGQ